MHKTENWVWMPSLLASLCLTQFSTEQLLLFSLPLNIIVSSWYRLPDFLYNIIFKNLEFWWPVVSFAVEDKLAIFSSSSQCQMCWFKYQQEIKLQIIPPPSPTPSDKGRVKRSDYELSIYLL